MESFIPPIEPPIESGLELTYYLPIQYSPIYKDIFKEIENLTMPDQLGVEGYGVRLSSLEDVLIKIDLKNGDIDSDEGNKFSMRDIHNYNKFKYGRCALVFRQLKACYLQKLIFLKRHWIIYFGFLVIVVILHWLITPSFDWDEIPKLSMDWNNFDSEKALFYRDGDFHGLFNISFETLSRGFNGDDHPTLYRTNSTTNSIQRIFEIDQEVGIIDDLVGSIDLSDTIEIGFNPSYLHGVPNIINTVVNAIAKLYISNSSKIEVYNSPMPFTVKTKMVGISSKNISIIILFNTIYSLILSYFSNMPLKEKVLGLKEQKLMTRLPASIYWIVHLHVDATIFMIYATFPIVLFNHDMDISGFRHALETATIYLGDLLGSISALAYLYSFTKVFKDEAVCVTVFNCVWFITGPVLLSIMNRFRMNPYENYYEIWFKIFDCVVWFPSYAYGSSFLKVHNNLVNRVICKRACDQRRMFIPNCTIEYLCENNMEQGYCCSTYFRNNF